MPKAQQPERWYRLNLLGSVVKVKQSYPSLQVPCFFGGFWFSWRKFLSNPTADAFYLGHFSMLLN